jgi:hypothetical protein
MQAIAIARTPARFQITEETGTKAATEETPTFLQVAPCSPRASLALGVLSTLHRLRKILRAALSRAQ